MKDIANGVPAGMEKVKCEVNDDDVDEIGKDEEEGFDLQKRTTPSKRTRQSQEPNVRDDHSSSNSGGGNKPFKPPRSLHSFLNKVKRATSAKRNPKAASKKK